MPTYSYACKDCDHAFDIVQSFTADSLTECPSCQGSLRKLFNSVGIVFKGSGFYRNDSRPASAGASGSNGTSDGKAETTPDTRTATASGTDSSAASPAAGASSSSPTPKTWAAPRSSRPPPTPPQP